MTTHNGTANDVFYQPLKLEFLSSVAHVYFIVIATTAYDTNYCMR